MGKMKKRATPGTDRLFNVVLYALSLLILVIILYPLYFIVIASFSDPSAVSGGKVWLVPVGFTVDGYTALFGDVRIWRSYGNTILYTALGTVFGLGVCLPAAYALSRKDLVFRKPLMLFFIIPMFFSGGLIPTFLTVRQFGLYNNLWVMIIPFAVSIYHVIVARTFFANSIPEALMESARIDGCGNVRFFFQMVLPLSNAIIAVLALWTAVGHWNSYFNALIYLRNENLMPLQIVLRNILITSQSQASMGTGEAAQIALRTASLVKYAAIIISTAPIMAVYPFLQKYFNQGVMIGAVKG
ncbi:MAG: carbohydrate ABC transporter permease [Spirochaetaceae bacterium]|jgi:putative aldouronate transport system permease protein|nr:carbohydrate ABC transporter permease [Spirochaetaceae bacterium]